MSNVPKTTTTTNPNFAAQPVPTSYLTNATKYNDNSLYTISILTISVLTLIVALAWRDYADKVIKERFIHNPSEADTVQFWYALVMTIITVVVITFLVKITKKN